MLIKNLLILISLIISTSLWADMDNICAVSWNDNTHNVLQTYIEKECERNNILEIETMPSYHTQIVISGFCRFDRQIVLTNTFEDNEKYNDLICVIYDNERRQDIK